MACCYDLLVGVYMISSVSLRKFNSYGLSKNGEF